MLLSIFISFVLARRFEGKKYVLLTTVSLVFISFLSFGFPSGSILTPSYYPLPFSFPFYTLDIVHSSWGTLQAVAETYEFWFFAFKITEIWGWYPLAQPSYNPNAPTMCAFFFNYVLINLIGAIFGYWISKTTFIERYVARRKPEERTGSV